MRFRRSRPPTNVFVLGTGRCGTTTFVKACSHLTNFTAAHESRTRLIGDERFAYPEQHIEADNRLTWFLGLLDRHFGAAPLYVHLRRDPIAVAESFNRRWGRGIIGAFDGAIVIGKRSEDEQRAMCHFYVETVTANIETFLQGKPNQMTVWLEESQVWFPVFWDRIYGQGDLKSALTEFDVRYNSGSAESARPDPEGRQS